MKKGVKDDNIVAAKDQEAFEKLKTLLSEQLVLQRFNADPRFFLRVDARNYAVGSLRIDDKPMEMS